MERKSGGEHALWVPSGKSQDSKFHRETYHQVGSETRNSLKMNAVDLDDIEDDVSGVDEEFPSNNDIKKRKASSKEEGPA